MLWLENTASTDADATADDVADDRRDVDAAAFHRARRTTGGGGDNLPEYHSTDPTDDRIECRPHALFGRAGDIAADDTADDLN